MVPWPGIMTTATSGRTRLMPASVSRPSRPGIQMSRNTTSGDSSASTPRASLPLPTAVTRYPSSSSTPRRLDWMARSSSTIRMCSPGMLGLHGGGSARGRQLDHEPAAARVVVLDADRAPVLGDDLLHDGQPEPHAAGLGGEVRLEQLLLVLAADPGAGVADDQGDPRRLPPRREIHLHAALGPDGLDG